ncbi:MAG: uncharacterized protein FRX49_07925 [Trebouxia sp. A1-2]|nr:MAG: uncharacterized protein FRX49_07925 [Trebouxia sp. A1-2]
MHHRDLLLKALKYPKPSKNLVEDDVNFASLIVWLENTKVRQYSIEDRKALSDTRNPSWDGVFRKYVKDVQCPIALEASSKAAVLDWLLSYAISLEYQDQADKFNTAALSQSRHKPALSSSQQEQHVYTDIDDPQTSEAIQHLLKQLQLVDTNAPMESLQAARNMVSDQLLPALEDSQLSSAAREAATQLSHLDVDKFPLGFTTGDKKTDVAATILRMLYIKDLRGLQTIIDETLVNVQNYTANPKTDAALGRIGR